MKPSNTPCRPSPRTRALSGSGEARGNRDRASLTHTPHSGRTVRIPATPGPTERVPWWWRAGRSGGGPSRSHGSPGCAEVLPALLAYSTARGPFQGAWAPGLLGEGPEVGGFSSAPASGRSPALEPPGVGLREQWTSVASGPAGGAAPALGRERGRAGALLRVVVRPPEERASPRAAQPAPESADSRRTRDPAVFSSGPAPWGGCFCSAHKPASSRRAEERKARARRPHPLGSAVTLKSQLLSKWEQYSRVDNCAEREVLSAPRARGHPTPRQTNQRAQSRGLRDTFQVPTPRLEPSGPAGHTGLSPGWRVRRMAGRRSRTSKVTAVLYPPPKTSRGARRGGLARRNLCTPERAVPLVPRP